MAKAAGSNARPEFKYNFDYQLKLLPRGVKIENVIEHLVKLNINRDVFYRDRKIPFGSAKSIPSDRLMIYAQVFDCSHEDLMNHKITAPSIREAIENPIRKKAISKSKLK